MTIARVIFALLLLTILGQQALRSAGRPRRRAALALAAAAFGIFALANGLALLEIDFSSLAAPLFGLPVLLMLASVVLLFLAWQAGEMSGQISQVQQRLDDERKKREL